MIKMKNIKSPYSELILGASLFALGIAGIYGYGTANCLEHARETQRERNRSRLEAQFIDERTEEEKAQDYSEATKRISGQFNKEFEEILDAIPTQTNKTEIKKKEYESPKQKNNYRDPISTNFLDKLQTTESTNNPGALSNKGARGLMQIMKPTWDEITNEIYGKTLNYELAFNPKVNQKVGTTYLKKINSILNTNLQGYTEMDTKDKQKQIAAAYNGGITRLLKNNGNISKMPKETRDYVKKIVN